ncbi:uncharacterized protein [Procambarus clarkii]|uniref:uncharacterized protein n=1 Tax=Procambarus clarkii TaxID=6728 RepID=UPI001E67457B|nr:uncharacterized protein LOC123765715 [Procambarus clarkii]
MSGRHIQEVQEALRISDTEGNRGASVVPKNLITIMKNIGTKRKGNDDDKVNKNSTSLLPATKRFCSSENVLGSSLGKTFDKIIRNNFIQEDISVGLSLQSQSVDLSNNNQMNFNYFNCLPAKISDTEVVSMRNETARNECLPNLGITDQTFDNNLPVIKDVWSETSVSGAVNGTQDCNLVNSQSGIIGLPIITEVTSLASSSNQKENIYGNQTGNAEVSINQTEKCQNIKDDSPATVNIMHGDGMELQILKVCESMDTSCGNQLCIPDKSQYGQNSQNNSPDILSENMTTLPLSNERGSFQIKSNKTADKISDVIFNHTLQNVSSVNQKISSNSELEIVPSRSSACSISTSASQNNPVSSFPQVSSCINAWLKVFPWMLFRETDHSFLCKICEWGAAHSCSHIVFALKAPSDVHFVAGHLRFHQEAPFHKMVESRRTIVVTLFKILYPILKESFYNGLDDLVSSVIKHNGGTFPGPQTSLHMKYFTSFMIKRIAENVEISLLESLAKSPFFSVTAAEDKNFAILRWLNLKGEPEEHFFCSEIYCPGKTMAFTDYLQSRKVDLTKMISFSNFPGKIVTPSNVKKSELPIRYPPFSLFMKWLEKVDLLKEVFPHLETLTRLCKSSTYMLNKFPEVTEFIKVENPFSHGCLVNERIIEFYFCYHNELKKTCTDLFNQTGNLDALSFSKFEGKNMYSVRECVSLLPKIHELLTKEDCSYMELYTSSKKLRSTVCAKLRSVEKLDSDEYIVLSLFDMYLSHVITSLHTPEQELVEVITRKLRQLTVNDVGKILTYLKCNYEGASTQCLHSLQRMCKQLSKNKNCCIYELLECFAKEPELCKDFPGLFHIYQKVKVLPFLHADTDQYMFNLAVLEVLSSNNDDNACTVHHPFLILLEGSPVEDINLDFVLEVWSNKWKMYYDKARLHL